MLMRVLWALLIVTNLAWFMAFRFVDGGGAQKSVQHQTAEQQCNTCERQVGKINRHDE